jgi:hypothetical protein
MKKRSDQIPTTAFDDDWLDKLLAGIAILICGGLIGFLLYSFTVI